MRLTVAPELDRPSTRADRPLRSVFAGCWTQEVGEVCREVPGLDAEVERARHAPEEPVPARRRPGRPRALERDARRSSPCAHRRADARLYPRTFKCRSH